MSCNCNGGGAISRNTFCGRNNGCGNNVSGNTVQNNTCGKTVATSCETYDGVPTRVYHSCGCSSCLSPSFETSSGCTSNTNSCGCTSNANSCGCTSNTNSCGCTSNTCGSSSNTCGSSSNTCGSSSNTCGCTSNGCGCSIAINPVGIPFWYGGYYNNGCNCCENEIQCDSSSAINVKNNTQSVAVRKSSTVK